jgi:hypothetical protein
VSERDPRDVAIDALEQARRALKRNLDVIENQIKHVCPHPSCGLRFYREDQVADHVDLVHAGVAR